MITVTDDQRARLCWVTVDERRPPDLSLFPDFFVIGPQRTGTTWLWTMLAAHPQVVMSDPKELFFFDTLGNPSHPCHKSDDLAWYVQRFVPRHRHRRRVRMWFRRLYGRPAHTIRGEATANYAAMDRARIDEALVLRPELRAILIVRDPVERAWSHAKKHLARDRGRAVEAVPDDEWRRFFALDYQRRCARYVEHADRWIGALRPGHLHVERFDAIAAEPRALLQRVFGFLGVDAHPRELARLPVQDKVNPTGENPVPERHRAHLEQLFADDLRAIDERFGWRWR